jgi:hypothetical protein
LPQAAYKANCASANIHYEKNGCRRLLAEKHAEKGQNKNAGEPAPEFLSVFVQKVFGLDFLQKRTQKAKRWVGGSGVL